MLDGIGSVISVLFWTCVVSVPLGLWKLVEIGIWVFSKVEITIK
jgi:hypothetical protein